MWWLLRLVNLATILLLSRQTERMWFRHMITTDTVIDHDMRCTKQRSYFLWLRTRSVSSVADLVIAMACGKCKKGCMVGEFELMNASQPFGRVHTLNTWRFGLMVIGKNMSHKREVGRKFRTWGMAAASAATLVASPLGPFALRSFESGVWTQ